MKNSDITPVPSDIVRIIQTSGSIVQLSVKVSRDTQLHEYLFLIEAYLCHAYHACTDAYKDRITPPSPMNEPPPPGSNNASKFH